MAGIKPFSQACVNNCQPILDVLRRVFDDTGRVLEIGSGTGQHAVYFAPALRHLHWHTSDRAENIPGIHAWIDDSPADNLHRPIELDVDGKWPNSRFDGFFSANTCHIMPWTSVVNLFEGVARVAEHGSVFALYGPFKYSGQFTTQSNASFDLWLKSIASHQGIRDIEDVIRLAEDVGFSLEEDNQMPANNQLLVFRNQARSH
jgi:cyclopropane fatty-acyl-phospholipid synthase-like methyltransferase